MPIRKVEKNTLVQPSMACVEIMLKNLKKDGSEFTFIFITSYKVTELENIL